MTERPILFSVPMVRAILSGAKTQTRRVVKEPGWATSGTLHLFNGRPWACDPLKGDRDVPCPYGQPGDRLWVRESLGYDCEWGHYFAADRKFLCELFDDEEAETGPSYDDRMPDRSIPSIHLPRRYSRITLAITSVRVERLQDISEADSIAEGVERIPSRPDRWFVYGTGGPNLFSETARGSFLSLWASLNGHESELRNPWVWALEFKRVEQDHG